MANRVAKIKLTKQVEKFHLTALVKIHLTLTQLEMKELFDPFTGEPTRKK